MAAAAVILQVVVAVQDMDIAEMPELVEVEEVQAVCVQAARVAIYMSVAEEVVVERPCV